MELNELKSKSGEQPQAAHRKRSFSTKFTHIDHKTLTQSVHACVCVSACVCVCSTCCSTHLLKELPLTLRPSGQNFPLSQVQKPRLRSHDKAISVRAASHARTSQQHPQTAARPHSSREPPGSLAPDRVSPQVNK